MFGEKGSQEIPANAGGANQGQDISLDSIRTACLDSRGFLICAARISNKTDKNGDLVIERYYLRKNFSFEDTRDAIKYFAQSFVKEASADLGLDA